MTCQLPVLKSSYAKYNQVSVIPRATAQNQSELHMPQFGKGYVQVPLEFCLSSPGAWLWAVTEIEGKQSASGESLEHRQPLPFYQ